MKHQFPLTMALLDNNDKEYLLWNCSRKSNDVCQSVFVNLSTGEQMMDDITMDRLDFYVKELEDHGWKKRFLPPIDIKCDWGVKLID